MNKQKLARAQDCHLLVTLDLKHQWLHLLIHAYRLSPLSIVEAQPSRHVVWRIHAEGRTVYFKAMPDGPGVAERLEWQISLLQFLMENGYSSLVPIRPAGADTIFLRLPEDWLGILYQPLPGRPCRAEPKEAASAGYSLGRLHRLSDGFESARGSTIIGVSDLIDNPLSLLEPYILDQGRETRARLDWFIPRLRLWLCDLPRSAGAFGVCHGDAHFDNAWIDEEGVVRFLDFEFAILCWRAYDLATFIWGTFRERFGAPIWNAFIRGYVQSRELGEQEAHWIRPFLVLRQLWWLGFQLATGNSTSTKFVSEGLDFLVRLGEETAVDAVLDERPSAGSEVVASAERVATGDAYC